jgi:MOSC domain-containing protein YiiM
MQNAHIFSINRSDGCVPKLAVHSGQVGFLGLEGDRQKHIKVHGGPEQALCLYSLECILELQREGHPAFPGSLGENLTLAGLDWEEVVPGQQLRLGAQVLVEVTNFTTPCNEIISSFSDGDSRRIDQGRYPGWSRVYAKVLQPGEIKIGDPVSLV